MLERTIATVDNLKDLDKNLITNRIRACGGYMKLYFAMVSFGLRFLNFVVKLLQD